MRRCYGCMRTIENEAHICPNCGYSEEERIEDNSLRPGTLLKGKYLTGKVIGAGGFGITYIGWDMAVEGVVAIKEYLPGDLATRVSGERGVTVYTGDEPRQYEKGRESFIKEAEKLASLQNEKEICQVLDYFEENNKNRFIFIFHYSPGKPPIPPSPPGGIRPVFLYVSICFITNFI